MAIFSRPERRISGGDGDGADPGSRSRAELNEPLPLVADRSRQPRPTETGRKRPV